MPYQFFHLSDTNPNDTCGGGGCVCSPQREIDCKGPYAVFPGNDMESIASPHVVIGIGCLKAALAQADAGIVLTAGERDPAEDDRQADALLDLARGDLDDEAEPEL